MASELHNLALDEAAYIAHLGDLISVAEQVQNAPSLGLIPKENLASDFVLKELEPQLTKNGGLLEVERIEFVAGRGNVVIKYVHPDAAKSTKTVAFIGSHLDVVPADPKTWKHNPFKLTMEGDKMYGRGTTDCLGHVALMTQLFLELSKRRIPLKTQVICVLIASEENNEIPDVGVEKLMETGKIDFIKNGPVLWVDCSDSQPSIGTAGVVTWELLATGKLFHSGLPHLGINSAELAMDALAKIQERFYQDFPMTPGDKEYNFTCPSTMKPSRVESSVNSLNQIPAWVKISGDIRLSPFYDMKEVMAKVQSYVADLNKDITVLEGPHRGPMSKYTLPAEDLVGKLDFKFETEYMEGIACSLDSVGYKSLYAATEKVLGETKPFSISGSLPLVRDLQRGGLDLTLAGFGISAVYHGDNEYCSLNDMKNALKILALFIANVENASA